LHPIRSIRQTARLTRPAKNRVGQVFRPRDILIWELGLGIGDCVDETDKSEIQNHKSKIE
jgi:hypothetical protein